MDLQLGCPRTGTLNGLKIWMLKNGSKLTIGLRYVVKLNLYTFNHIFHVPVEIVKISKEHPQ